MLNQEGPPRRKRDVNLSDQYLGCRHFENVKDPARRPAGTDARRRADVLELANYFLDRHRATRERAVALASSAVIELDDLPATVRCNHTVAVLPSIERDDTLRAWGSRYVGFSRKDERT
jgi:hypothetical protein